MVMHRETGAEGEIADTPNETAVKTSIAIAFLEATMLFNHSKLHQRQPVSTLMSFLFTPIRLQQFRLIRSKSRTVGLVTWAHFDEDAEWAFVAKHRPLTLADWTSGDRLWCIDYIAPFGHMRQVADALAATTSFSSANSLRSNQDKDFLKIYRIERDKRALRCIGKLRKDIGRQKGNLRDYIQRLQ